ncbi:hypothetical protein EV356DRAFT_509378, partial [Viridothelium virens]
VLKIPNKHNSAVIYTPLKCEEAQSRRCLQREAEARRREEALQQQAINRQVQNKAKHQRRSKQKQLPLSNQLQNNVVEVNLQESVAKASSSSGRPQRHKRPPK